MPLRRGHLYVRKEVLISRNKPQEEDSERLGEGIDHQRNPTHIHTFFDFLSGFSVSSWPG